MQAKPQERSQRVTNHRSVRDEADLKAELTLGEEQQTFAPRLALITVVVLGYACDECVRSGSTRALNISLKTAVMCSSGTHAMLYSLVWSNYNLATSGGARSG